MEENRWIFGQKGAKAAQRKRSLRTIVIQKLLPSSGYLPPSIHFLFLCLFGALHGRPCSTAVLLIRSPPDPCRLLLSDRPAPFSAAVLEIMDKVIHKAAAEGFPEVLVSVFIDLDAECVITLPPFLYAEGIEVFCRRDKAY